MAEVFESNFSIRKILGENEGNGEVGNLPPSPPLSDGSLSPDLLDRRPGFTFSALIAMAIRSSVEKRMTLSSILDWISENFPYYRRDQPSWQSQIRHTLSTNSCFKKVPRALDDPGRGNYWIISRDIEDVKVSLSTGRLETITQGEAAFAQMHFDGYGNQLNQVITRGVPINHPQAPNAVYFPTPEELGMAQHAVMMQALQEQQIWFLFHQKQQHALQHKLINMQQQQFQQQYDQLYQQMMFHQQQCEFMMAKQLPM